MSCSFFRTLTCTAVMLSALASHASTEPDTYWTYKTVGGTELKLSVFLPEGYEDGGPFPAFVVFHGGSWRTGDPSWHYPDCAYWASRGMVAVSVDYRLKDRDNVEVPLECVKDAKSAIRFLRTNADRLKIDPDRIVAAGGSAGGQLAASTAMITGEHTNDEAYEASVSPVPNAVVLYNPWFKCEEDLSPPFHVKPGLPPMITFLGEKDVIPAQEILDFHNRLTGAGIDSEFYLAREGKHGFCNGRNPQNPFFYWSLNLVDSFLVKHGILSGPSKVAVPEGVRIPGADDYTAYAGGLDAAAGAAIGRPRPNVILMLTDDLGWQDVDCYDIDEPSPMETPNIDRLAKKGVLFRQGYAPAPTCAPTRCAILSGIHPARAQKTHVVGGRPPHPHHKSAWAMMSPWYSGRMPEDTFTLARALKQEGYTTGHCGKWHIAINHAAFPQPMDVGFDWTRSNLGTTRSMQPHRLTGFATTDPDDPYRLDANGYPYHQNSEDALTFVRENKDKPFFLYYCTWLVHTPIHTRSRELLDKYVKKLGVELPENPEEWKGEGQTNPFYCAMVEELDYHAGRLFSYLEETDDPRWPGHKLIENTYIIFTSDNGGMEQVPNQIITDNYPLDRGKISLMEGGTRVPLIITGPGIGAGIESDVMVNGLDFYPTILSLTGAGKPEGKHFDGADLSVLLHADPTDPELVTGPDGRRRDTMVWHFPNSAALESTIRVGDYKLVRNYDHTGHLANRPLELYRLYRTEDGVQIREDIEEARDLAAEMPEKARELNEKLSAALEEMDASYPYFNPDCSRPLPGKDLVPVVLSHRREDSRAVFTFREQGAAVVRADLIYTLNGGDRYEEWFRAPAVLAGEGTVTAELPDGTTHYFINLIDENNFLVSFPDPMGGGQTVANRDAKYAEHALAFDAPAAAAESEQPVDPMFVRLDRDRNGAVTRDEYVGTFTAGFDRMDRNSDGRLDGEEFPYPAALKGADVDGDGQLTPDELVDLYEKQFDGRDQNRDGVVTADEM